MGTLDGRVVVVVGFGRSGRSAARLALREGARVIAADTRAEGVVPMDGVELQLGPHRRDTFTGADVLVVSPGVPAAQPDVAAAIAAGVDVVGELGFGARYVTAPVVAITGTNGKSTVTACTGRLLAADGRAVFVGGNLGTALCDAAFEQPDVCVVEVSSYQLELPGGFAPRVAAILNLTPDHLARHGTIEAYGATKARLFARMPADGVAFLPHGDARLAALAEGVGRAQRAWIGGLPGVVRDGRQVAVELPGIAARLDLRQVRLQGAHNLDHAATAAALALAAGADPKAVQGALGTLQPLPHRMEPVADLGGVLWIDDSKATNVEAAEVAIRGVDRPAVVLLGGQAKGGGFGALAPALRRHRAVITFGQDGAGIAEELLAAGVAPIRVGTMEDAMRRAQAIAAPGDAVLLSPGCASFDAFQDFEHRGRVFAAFAQRRP